jgi:integration host factor subunit beta
MNKSELIDAIAAQKGISFKKAEEIINTVFDAMTTALISGERIEIRGFGSFVIKEYRAYTGRNPKTGESISVKPKKLPFFKVGKELKERVSY